MSTLLSASQAAKEVGKSVPTITRAIKKGKISATKTDEGGYQIDPAELFRVFPKPSSVTPKETVSTPKMLGDETLTENKVLQIKLEAIRKELELANLERERERDKLEAHIETLKAEVEKKDGALERAHRDKDQIIALLTNQKDEQDATGKRTGGLFSFLQGKG